ncbi:hypothetical protein MPER_07912, partial [Moniliophthora perniciosa FA553]
DPNAGTGPSFSLLILALRLIDTDESSPSTLASLYIWTTLIAGSTTSTAAVRQPLNNSPVADVTSKDLGAPLASSLTTRSIIQGPAAIYLGKAPGSVANWDGSGANWFKIAEWGATFNPFQFTDFNANQLTTTIPSSVPPGEYLVRIEQIGLHVAGAPQFYISCAQINITGGGNANPAKVSIPGYVSPSDPGLTVNIYYPVPTSYKVPGPAPFRG